MSLHLQKLFLCFIEFILLFPEHIYFLNLMYLSKIIPTSILSYDHSMPAFIYKLQQLHEEEHSFAPRAFTPFLTISIYLKTHLH